MHKTMEDALNYIFNKRSNLFVKNLENFKVLLKELKIDFNKSNVIHVVGTNGKGSVVNYLSNLLINSGYKVGTFTSPHILKVNERICINNTYISDSDFLRILNEIDPIIANLNNNLSFFEYLVVISLKYFNSANLDYIIYEAGVGGLYDSTNIFNKKLLNILTSISLDHTEILGNTVEEITRQKLGIVNPNEILMHNEETIIKICNEMLVTNICISKYKFDTRPDYDSNNLSLAIEAFKFITHKDVSDEEIAQLKRPKCRLEEYKKDIILDVGHNIDGVMKVSNYVLSSNKYNKYTVIYSGILSKDYNTIIEYLIENFDNVYITKNSNSHSINKDNIIHYLSNNNVIYTEDIKSILHSKSDDELILIIGSFYFISDILK